jgi:hypothetical protein
MAMLARDIRPARAFRDAAASDLNNFEIGPAFDQGFVRALAYSPFTLMRRFAAVVEMSCIRESASPKFAFTWT